MKILSQSSSACTGDDFFNYFIAAQIYDENNIPLNHRKKTGTFFTNDLVTIDRVINVIEFNDTLLSQKILEPSCGHGIFILRILFKIYHQNSEPDYMAQFIENNLFFIDINEKMLQKTKENINQLYFYLFRKKYSGKFNDFCCDFTYKNKDQELPRYNPKLEQLYGRIDYIIGNPPYITLYGRRDQKTSEAQREYYLRRYFQFPKSVKNGKINYIMLFLEHSIEFLKYDGRLSFIVDISFFETAYTYTRKFLLENTQIDEIIYNIQDFSVASGQLILKLTRKIPLAINDQVRVINAETEDQRIYNQSAWYRDDDEYKYRIFICNESEKIVNHIINTEHKTLKELYGHKNLRTCAMLLDMENKFVFPQPDLNPLVNVYPYYRGAKSLKEKFGILEDTGFFYYDKNLQDTFNEIIKKELFIKGIKNKKRIGLGEKIIYDYPKVYIRQSAKSIIAAYDEKPSAANNSLYVFSLRNNSDSSLKFLRFICAYLNSDLLTFFCQKKQIIRYSKGKQPQIKLSDLYSIPIPISELLISELANLTDYFYTQNTMTRKKLLDNVNNLVYDYYQIDRDSILFIQQSIQSF